MASDLCGDNGVGGGAGAMGERRVNLAAGLAAGTYKYTRPLFGSALQTFRGIRPVARLYSLPGG
jgi:hypothetical protein